MKISLNRLKSSVLYFIILFLVMNKGDNNFSLASEFPAKRLFSTQQTIDSAERALQLIKENKETFVNAMRNLVGSIPIRLAETPDMSLTEIPVDEIDFLWAYAHTRKHDKNVYSKVVALVGADGFLVTVPLVKKGSTCIFENQQIIVKKFLDFKQKTEIKTEQGTIIQEYPTQSIFEMPAFYLYVYVDEEGNVYINEHSLGF